MTVRGAATLTANISPADHTGCNSSSSELTVKVVLFIQSILLEDLFLIHIVQPVPVHPTCTVF